MPYLMPLVCTWGTWHVCGGGRLSHAKIRLFVQMIHWSPHDNYERIFRVPVQCTCLHQHCMKVWYIISNKNVNCAPLLSDIFCTHTKRNSYSPCFRPVGHGSTSHIDTLMTYCPLVTQILGIISVRCIPLSLTSKTQRRATLLLPTWIYSCQSVGTVNFALPFTTSVTISISILQTFRSWVATSHPRQPMAC